ncbi:hypothetical protein HG263_10590 [Pseudoalteromonas sp. JBTF-M23]|uniref:Uncharacterized protein n=1 Tax=Pseudoalteromonas caenipelagi TaxID=2726988 RepID=A0A849VBH0_9GAMM|nr:hypothetical protein [Pseudoalteromonas caenipelagi]
MSLGSVYIQVCFYSPLGSTECALFIVAKLLLGLLGGKSSVATKAHSKEQKLNNKDQQALILRK